MFSVAAMRKQARTRVVDGLRSAGDAVELLLAEFDQPGSVIGCRMDHAVLRAHDGLHCCAGCGAVACNPGSEVSGRFGRPAVMQITFAGRWPGNQLIFASAMSKAMPDL